ncbi:MAG: hypothetical protein ACHQ1H_02930 [Nitrososphaerales archaeon]
MFTCAPMDGASVANASGKFAGTTKKKRHDQKMEAIHTRFPTGILTKHRLLSMQGRWRNTDARQLPKACGSDSQTPGRSEGDLLMDSSWIRSEIGSNSPISASCTGLSPNLGGTFQTPANNGTSPDHLPEHENTSD